MNDKKEIEIKFSLQNPKEVTTLLEEIATFKYEASQIDEYFNPPHKDFTNQPKIYEWLRLRTSNDKFSINYKDYSPEVFCYEYESEVSSKKDFISLLEALNFTPLVTVNKKRKVFVISDVEISIDEVKDLGCFIELEYKGVNENIDEVQAHLFDVLKKIRAQTGVQDKRGYPYELLIKKGIVK